MADPELINTVVNAQELFVDFEFRKNVLLWLLWFRFREALQQNIIHDPFYIDWQELGGDLDGLGGPGDSHLKEYQSFSSIKQSRDKIVTCVQWHPTLRGMIRTLFSIHERENNVFSRYHCGIIGCWSKFRWTNRWYQSNDNITIVNSHLVIRWSNSTKSNHFNRNSIFTNIV